MYTISGVAINDSFIGTELIVTSDISTRWGLVKGFKTVIIGVDSDGEVYLATEYGMKDYGKIPLDDLNNYGTGCNQAIFDCLKFAVEKKPLSKSKMKEAANLIISCNDRVIELETELQVAKDKMEDACHTGRLGGLCIDNLFETNLRITHTPPTITYTGDK